MAFHYLLYLTKNKYLDTDLVYAKNQKYQYVPCLFEIQHSKTEVSLSVISVHSHPKDQNERINEFAHIREYIYENFR